MNKELRERLNQADEAYQKVEDAFNLACDEYNAVSEEVLIAAGWVKSTLPYFPGRPCWTKKMPDSSTVIVKSSSEAQEIEKALEDL